MSASKWWAPAAAAVPPPAGRVQARRVCPDRLRERPCPCRRHGGEACSGLGFAGKLLTTPRPQGALHAAHPTCHAAPKPLEEGRGAGCSTHFTPPLLASCLAGARQGACFAESRCWRRL